ncbi:hypothetical protein IJ541_07250 [bacterium]|nr:hypothetical protein [bacterium]
MDKDKWKSLDKKIQAYSLDELMKDAKNPFDTCYSLDTTAFLNWRFDPSDRVEAHFFRLAEGYFEVAIYLLRECIEATGTHNILDIWIFPILFNIVHGIELYLKGFNSLYPIYKKLEKFEGIEESSIKGKHDIKQLHNVAMSLINNNHDKVFKKSLLYVRKFIDIIYEYTDDMSFGRYPIGKSKSTKDPHFYVSRENVTLDLTNLYVWVKRISYEFDCITGYLEDMTGEMTSIYNEVMAECGERI